MTTTFTKRIEPVFVYDGKVRRGRSGKHLVGFDGYLDGVKVVFCATSETAARSALDELAYDQLVSTADVQAEIDAMKAEAA